jgi:hypothetical protein
MNDTSCLGALPWGVFPVFTGTVMTLDDHHFGPRTFIIVQFLGQEDLVSVA